MAENNSSTSAEKQLLNTIEGGAEGQAKTVKSAAVKLKKPSAVALKSRLNFFADSLKSVQLNQLFKHLDIANINKILYVVAILVLFWSWSTLNKGYKQSRMKLIISPKKPTQIAGAASGMISSSAGDIAAYLDEISRRNIFERAEKKAISTSLAPNQAAISEMVKDLRLAGISWDPSPENTDAMIEHTKDKLTYFVKEGDKLLNLTVKKILQDRVVFGYQNEEYVLR